MIEFTVARQAPASADVTVVGAFNDGKRSRDIDWNALDARGFEPKVGQVQIAGSKTPPGSKGRRSKGVVAVAGLGDAAKLDATQLRKVGAAVAKALKKQAVIATDIPTEMNGSLDTAAAVQAFAEGVVLGSYSFETYKSKATPSAIERVVLITRDAAIGEAAQLGAAIAGAVNFARDLVNEPGGTLTPPELAVRAEAMAKRAGLKAKVHDEAAIKKLKLGGLLGVNRGSAQPPRFVELEYKPAGWKAADGTLAFVGKGLTFDSGGLSLKTGVGMMTMKCDMSGAAAVFGAMSVLPTVAARCRVLGYVPITDNMTGADATRPGDVLKARNGKTIEVLNTDAEGRLILADALSLASEAKPDAIVDLATLTGACMVALGPSIAGLMGNNDEFNRQVQAAADRAGERMWPLPLPADYRKQLDSPVADMKNIGGPYGGSSVAGLFLQEFVGESIAWVHLDIAGPAFLEADDGEHPKGGTGFGVRALVELARTFTRP